MKQFQRLLSILLCCMLCLSWFPMGIRAAENDISVGDQVTLTIEHDQSVSFSFTPEESGYYYFYNSTDQYVEDPSTGYWYSANFYCSIYDENRYYVGDYFYSPGFCGAYAYLKAGKTYSLTAESDCYLEVPVTNTLYLAKPEQTDIFFTGCSGKMYVDTSITLYCMVTEEFPIGASLTWEVSDPAVVELTYTSDYYANLKAVGLGTATVTATADDGRRVSQSITVSEIETLTPGSQRRITLAHEETAMYTFTAEESGYYYFYSSDFDCSMYAYYEGYYLDTQYFSCADYSGNYCYLEPGTVCELMVYNYSEGAPRTATVYLDMPDQSAPYISGTTTHSAGDFWSMYFCVGNGVSVACDTVTWTVSDPAVVTISYQSNGYCSFKGVSAGTATITATTDDGRSASVECTVLPYTLEHSLVFLRSQDTVDLNVYRLKGVTWESSDPSVATVDENGVVTSVSEGTAKITAYQDGVGLQTATVIVQKKNSSGQAISLTLWAPNTEAELLTEMFPAFARNNSQWDIHLEVFSCAAGDTPRAMGSNPEKPADVYHFANDQIRTLWELGALKPLSGALLSRVTADNAQTMLDSVRGTDGELYGLPFAPNTWFMYYNKDIFTEEDVKSLETMLAKGKVAFEVRNSWYVGAFFFANGGTIFGEQGIDVSQGFQLGGEKGNAAAKRLVELVNESNFIVDGDGTGNAGIKAGTIGAYFSGIWDYPALYEALGDKLGMATLPTVEIDGKTKQLKAFTGSRAIGIHPDSAYPEAAQALAEFLASAEFQKERFYLTREAPVSKSLMDDADILQEPLALAQINNVYYASILQPSLMEMNYFWGPMGTFGYEMADGYITMDNVEAKVQQMVDEMNSKIQVITTVDSGWSGATQWTLTSDGVMTVYGSGNMKNYGYNRNQPWLAYADRIKSIVIEEGVAAIGTGAFMDLTKLESITLPESGLKTIGEAAFYGCSSLKSIDIPDTVYTVFDYTFKNCVSLEEVSFSKILIKIGQGAFENCTSLDYVYIPTNVGIIGSWSFKGCTGLVEADMTWADATKIREGAFKNCSALTTIHLPTNIQTLGDSCFYGIGATSFTVPATVTKIEAWCFARAYSLKSITFQGDAPSIGEGAFNKITLTAYYDSGNATWTSAIMQNYGGTVTWEAN